MNSSRNAWALVTLTGLLLAFSGIVFAQHGDDDNQGRYLRMPAGEFTIRRVRLYRYH